MRNSFQNIQKKGSFCCRKMFTLFMAPCLIFSLDGIANTQMENEEQTAITITEEDFQKLVREREQGVIGFHKNVDLTPMIPAAESEVLNWAHLPAIEKNRLSYKQEEMFRQGKITMIVMAGGEATRFGGPKTFVSVSEDLGEFLQIKAANHNWMRNTYGTNVPMYILSSEKRLHEFKTALLQKKYYGFKPENFRWFVQGTVDTFIPVDEELKAHFQGKELNMHFAYASCLREANQDGIYRFKGERRKVPGGHFDAIAAFMISGLFNEALEQGIDYALIVNIDNLQAILKNDGMIAYFAEQGKDIGFLLAEKNLKMTIKEKATDKVLQNKLIVRFSDNIISFDGLQEYNHRAEKDGYRYVINQTNRTVDVYQIANGKQIETKTTVEPETGGTLVQLANEMGEPIGHPIMKEGFELPLNFDHAKAPFFNTNTCILNLKSLLKFINVSQEELIKMSFEERSTLVRENLIKQIKPNFEFKNHEVEGEYPELGIVKNGKTKILVVQVTRIMLQAAHIQGAKVGYLFAPRASVFAPVKEPEDKQIAAQKNRASLQRFTLYGSHYR